MIVSLKDFIQIRVDLIKRIGGCLNILDLAHMLRDKYQSILDRMYAGNLIQVKIDGFDYGIRSINQYAYCAI